MIAALLMIAAVAVLALALRLFGGRGEAIETPRSDGSSEDEESDAGADDDEYGEGGLVEAAAITSDGWSFVPRGEGLELVPPGEEDELLDEQAKRHGSAAIQQAMGAAPVNPQTGRLLVFWRPGEPLSAGDMIAARVVRGAPSVDPWRLEALGRDYDYRPFAFETEEAARTALELVQSRIVRPPLDERGNPIPVGAEDFTVARRQYDETEQALAMDQDEEKD